MNQMSADEQFDLMERIKDIKKGVFFLPEFSEYTTE